MSSFTSGADLETSSMGSHTLHTVINVIRIDQSGSTQKLSLPLYELVKHLDRVEGLPRRPFAAVLGDLQIFLYTVNAGDGVMFDTNYLEIYPRTKCAFFLVDILDMKIICHKEYCLILDHNQPEETNCSKPASIDGLVESLRENISTGVIGVSSEIAPMQDVYEDLVSILGTPSPPFVISVLGTILHVVTNSFERKLQLLSSFQESLRKMAIAKPSDSLSDLFAFGTSLTMFQNRVESVKQSIEELLKDKSVLSDLSLSDNKPEEQEEVKFLLESYRNDLRTISLKIESLAKQVKYTRQDVQTLRDQARNDLIGMSLRTEIAMLGVGFVAMIVGIFGMNLKSTLEDHDSAFFLTVGVTYLVAFALTTFLLVITEQIMKKSAIKPVGPALRDFVDHLDEWEPILKDRVWDVDEFENVLHRMADILKKSSKI